MRKQYLAIISYSLTVVLVLMMWGCSNPDEGTDPVVPPPSGSGSTSGDMDPLIPNPFDFPFGNILDIGIEGDGDMVFATGNGIQLFTPYGVHKRLLTPAAVFVGIATSNFGQVDTGRGVMAISPEINECRPTALYDDLYVTGGVPHVSYNPMWWDGEPDPYYPNVCVPVASTSTFSSCNCRPHPIAYHPVTAFAYQKVFAPDCIADSDCDWPFTNVVPAGGHAILAYHRDAPFPPYDMTFYFEGNMDFIVYYDYPTYMGMQNLAAMLGVVPACTLHSLYVIWDINDMMYMSSRNGMVCANICDFEFDMLNRLIIAMPNADSVAITDPVVFGEPINCQQVLGGRQNGMGTLPGEFQGPTAVAIDPRNQDILISDTGNNRVQIFDNDGNFKREFGATFSAPGAPPFTPGAIRVDAFGAIYVANIHPDRIAGDDLRIFNEHGSPVIYGTLEGWVYDKETSLPIDNARVRIQSTFMPLDDITDGDGHFIFPAVASGTHNIVAEKYSYNSGQVNVTVNGGQKTMVDIYLDRTMTEPPGYGQITGTVFSTLYNQPVGGLTAEIVGLGMSNQTNGNGEFILYNVPAGDHTFRLTRDGTIWYEKYVSVSAGGILDIGWIYLPIP